MMKLKKSQKHKKRKMGKRCFKAFIYNVSWWYNGINFELDNSYIYEKLKMVTYKNGKTVKVISLPKLPRWNDITRIQEGAYFAKFLAETREFSNIKAFTLDFTCTRHADYKNKKLRTIKDDYAKKVYNSLRYHLGNYSIDAVYIVEGKKKKIHIHGFIDVFRIKDLKDVLKQSASTYKKEYDIPKYRNMLQIKEYNGGSYGWFSYMNKGCHSENGLYFSRSLMERVRKDYQALYEKYENIIKQLRAEGIKIIYEPDEPEEDV